MKMNKKEITAKIKNLIVAEKTKAREDNFHKGVLVGLWIALGIVKSAK